MGLIIGSINHIVGGVCTSKTIVFPEDSSNQKYLKLGQKEYQNCRGEGNSIKIASSEKTRSEL